MKMIPFVIIFIAVISLMHIYICIRTYQSLEYIANLRIPAIATIITLIVIFILNQSGIMLSVFGSKITESVSFFSSSWIFILFWIFLFILFFDILRGLNHLIGFFPSIIKTNYILVKFIVMNLVIATTFIWYILGYLNFSSPSKTELDIFVNKPQIINDTKVENNLKMVVISDVHIGYIVNKKKLREYVDSINTQDADIVLIVGDLVDNAIEPIIDQKIYEELMDIKSRLGVYVVTGNHEYIGSDKDTKVSYFRKSGLIVLEDSVVLVNESFYLVGRKDRMDRNRKPTKELLQGLENTNKPIILLDHQPFNLEESVDAGVDLHLSGHTHDGQFFPINLITKAMYELSAGYKLKEKTHIYVSSGLGLWGPPVRIGTKSEFVVINMKW